MRIVLGSREQLNGAALVWAAGTAARDGQEEVAPLALARLMIAEVLDEPGSLLVVALDDDDAVLAFALAAPIDAETAEVRFVGVSPAAWGRGLGRGVLVRLTEELVAAGFGAAELLVYVDNTNAVALYEGQGWRPISAPSVHPRSGKPERRYRIELSV